MTPTIGSERGGESIAGKADVRDDQDVHHRPGISLACRARTRCRSDCVGVNAPIAVALRSLLPLYTTVRPLSTDPRPPRTSPGDWKEDAAYAG
jgi:hypothetical protein